MTGLRVQQKSYCYLWKVSRLSLRASSPPVQEHIDCSINPQLYAFCKKSKTGGRGRPGNMTKAISSISFSFSWVLYKTQSQLTQAPGNRSSTIQRWASCRRSCAAMVSLFSVSRSREERRLKGRESTERSSGWKKCEAERLLCWVDVREMSLLILQVPRRNVTGSPRLRREDNLSGEHGCGPTGRADRHSWSWSGGGGGCGRTLAVDQCTQLWWVRNTSFNGKSASHCFSSFSFHHFFYICLTQSFYSSSLSVQPSHTCTYVEDCKG